MTLPGEPDESVFEIVVNHNPVAGMNATKGALSPS